MRGVICLLSLLSLSITAQAHFFTPPTAWQTSDESHIGGIQWSKTKDKVQLAEDQGSIDQTAITVPWFLSKEDWLYVGGFAALNYKSKSRGIKTTSSNSEQSLYGFAGGLQLVAEKEFFEILAGGASIGYGAALDDARENNFKIVTHEPIARVFLRREVSTYFVATIAAELARPTLKISYKDANHSAESSTLPSTNRQHYYVGFTSEFKGIELGVATVLGDRRGFYVTLINKP